MASAPTAFTSGALGATQPDPQSTMSGPANPSTEEEKSGRGIGVTTAYTASTSGKGGGALRSVSETFNVNPANGSLDFAIPIRTSPARSSIAPSLSLTYSSGSGNGPFGFGWQLPLSSITRKTSMGLPKYDATDVYILSDFEDLVPVSPVDSDTAEISSTQQPNIHGFLVKKFCPKIDAKTIRVEQWTNSVDAFDVHWRTYTGENITTIYGKSDNSRVFSHSAPGDKFIFSWLPTITYDPYGNAMEYRYKAENSEGLKDEHGNTKLCEAHRSDEIRGCFRYLKSIHYGNRKPNRNLEDWSVVNTTIDDWWLFQVVLDYGEHDSDFPTTSEVQPWRVRSDPFSTYRSGFELRSYRICKRIMMFHLLPDKPEELGKPEKPEDFKSYERLVASTTFGYDERSLGSFLTAYTSSGHVRSPNAKQYITQSLPLYSFEYQQPASNEELQLAQLDTSRIQAVPGSQAADAQWLDLDGSGVSGIFRFGAGAWSYQKNEKAINTELDAHEFGPTQYLQTAPSLFGSENAYFEDLDQNGCLDVVCTDAKGNAVGFHERLLGGWTDFTLFSSCTKLDIDPNQIKRIDLTGDGSLDILVMDESSDDYFWYRSLAKQGFDGDRRAVTAKLGTVSGDQRSSVFLADMSGDGLSDLVKISNGEIMYWPNCGYGHFAEPVRMDDAPLMASDELFSLSRLRLADIRGCGTTDLLYFPLGGGVDIYYNLAGNGWSKASRVSVFPTLDDLSSVYMLDLFGNGTSCLCWSGVNPAGNPSLFYIDLCGGKKPYLLSSYTNGIGKDITVQYRPSTWFSMKDSREGLTWKGTIPFPVQCVSRLTVTDNITSSVSNTRYAYHEGFYDGVLKEFRGFGMVEVWETEGFTKLGQGRYRTPTTYTKSWYSTGTTNAHVSSQVFSDPLLPPSSLPPRVTLDGHREALRALKGKQLRQEIYADIRKDHSAVPFTVSEWSYDVKEMQGRTKINPGVHQVNPSETLTIVYEQAEDSPRMEHELNLEINDYGDCLKKATIAYGRKPDPSVPAKAAKSQAVTSLTYQEFDYADPITEGEWFWKPALTGNRHYVMHSKRNVLYSLSDLVASNFKFFTAATELDSIDVDVVPEGCKAFLKENRQYYLSGDLSHPLDYGKFQAYSIPDQNYELAMSSSMRNLIDKELNGQQDPEWSTAMRDQGGYVDLDGNNNWWRPSAKLRFSADSQAELQNARSSFYIPVIEINPFGDATSIEMDRMLLFPLSKTDVIGNVVTTDYDYTCLQPVEVTDVNGNRIQTRYDALGNVVGVSLAGKEDEKLGDTFDDFEVLLTDEQSTAFMENPNVGLARRLLGSAGSRTIYGFPSPDTRMPAFQAEITRETHHFDRAGENGTIMVRFIYLDGSARPLQDAKTLLGDGGTTQWLFSEQEVKDTRGNAIRKSQPYYNNTHHFSTQVHDDVLATTLFYDPLGRLISTLNPDHTWTKTRYSAWGKDIYDAGDLILSDPTADPDIGTCFQRVETRIYQPSWFESSNSSDREMTRWDFDAVAKSKLYANTPQVVHYDSLGREVVVISDTGSKKLLTHQIYDCLGNISKKYDARGRLAERSQYDYLHRPFSITELDSGKKWTLLACDDQPIMNQHASGAVTRFTYDALRRTKQTLLTEGGLNEMLIHKYVYGETEADAARNNLRGKLVRVYDQSGLSISSSFDFKGNLVSKSQQLARNYKSVVDWNTEALEDEVYPSTATWNAFNQKIQSLDCKGNETKRTYDLGGGIASVYWRSKDSQSWTGYITNITYAADGKVLAVKRGNRTTTEYEYDSATRLKVREKTTRADRTVMRHVTFSYDIYGKRTHQTSLQEQSVYFRNTRADPDADYTYDATGQLISAKGREQVDVANGANSLFSVHAAHGRAVNTGIPSNNTQLAEYQETYKYDDAGNITSLSHQPIDPQDGITGWTRKYHYEEASFTLTEDQDVEVTAKFGNRLSRTTVGGEEGGAFYKYDVPSQRHGCPIVMPGFSNLSWDFQQRLRSSATQRVNTGMPETTWYVYDITGSRVRKLTERESDGETEPSKLQETFFLPDIDLFFTYSGTGSVTSKRTSAHVIGTNTVALVEQTEQDAQTTSLIRYQLDRGLELDDLGQVVWYEECSPFGATTYVARRSQLEAPRKYRFAAYERDTESGLDYCKTRYYASWIGRWLTPDTISTADGLNLYAYVHNDPVNLVDPLGTKSKDGQSSEEEKESTPRNQAYVPTGRAHYQVGPNAREASLAYFAMGMPEVQEGGMNDPRGWVNESREGMNDARGGMNDPRGGTNAVQEPASIDLGADGNRSVDVSDLYMSYIQEGNIDLNENAEEPMQPRGDNPPPWANLDNRWTTASANARDVMTTAIGYVRTNLSAEMGTGNGNQRLAALEAGLGAQFADRDQAFTGLANWDLELQQLAEQADEGSVAQDILREASENVKDAMRSGWE